MFSIPELGHRAATDLEALRDAAAKAWRLVEEEVFPGEGALISDRVALTVEGASLRVEFWLQQDYLGADIDHDRTMIALRFAPAGEEIASDPWTLYVRGHWPERTDRFSRVGPLKARRLRKTLAPRRRRDDDPHRDTFKSDAVYVMRTTPPDDLTAQVVLFALQVQLTNDPDLFRWLEDYIARTFRIRVRERKEVASDVVAELLQNKWWPEDARAWRKYVASVRMRCQRRYQPFDGSSSGEGKTREAHARVGELSNGAPDALLTIEEASQRAGVSRSTMYAWVDGCRLPIVAHAGRMLIEASELDRFLQGPPLKTVIDAVAARRACSRDTARKYVHRLQRAGRSLDEIVSSARGGAVTRSGVPAAARRRS